MLSVNLTLMPELAPDFNHNQPVYSISEIGAAIKRTVEDRFGTIKLRGEISGWKVASSGHAYFRLKDDKAVIDAVSWKGTISKLSFKAEDGLDVICTGKITTYPGRSTYQIVVEHIEPAGVGALMALFEKRKKQMEEEGLFAEARKKPLPFLPQTIGVITSPTGAVIRDILHRIEERFPVHVLVWPVLVQGEDAAEQVAAAIEGFNALEDKPDLLIVARGGGSIEDLWAFNEELPVRAAANSTIPIISAVGHETDTTLMDFVADKRAPTPTAAAEMAVPVRRELWLGIKELEARMHSAAQNILTGRTERLQGLARGLPKPAQLLDTATQRLDDFAERLRLSLPNYLGQKTQSLAVLSAQLAPKLLLHDMHQHTARLLDYQERMKASAGRLLAQKQDKLKNLISLLESLNYKNVLARGFALVRTADGQVVTTAKNAKTQKELSLTFADGDVVTKIHSQIL